jgi:hypothetical protein
MDLPKGFHREVIEAKENDPVDFTEPSIKKRVDISPLKPGGSNFKTHALIEQSSSKLYYRPSLGGAVFGFTFFAIGLGFTIFNISFEKGLMQDLSLFNFFGLGFGLLFAFVGGFMLYYLYKPRVFDKQSGYYYKGYNFRPNEKHLKHQFRLHEIIAIQIIGETIRGKNGSYGSFELNLVLNDGTRRNVVDHGNLKSIIDDAHCLSEFLNVPIWHAQSRTE